MSGTGLELVNKLAKRVQAGGGWWHPSYLGLLAAVATSLVLAVILDLPSQAFALLLLLLAPPIVVLSSVLDRREWPAHELMAWLLQQSRAEWRAATGTPMPLTRRRLAAWAASPAAGSAPPAYRALGLANAGQFSEARRVASEADQGSSPAEIADLAATRSQIEFLEAGNVELAAWREAAAALPRAEARSHLVAMAIIQSARALGDGHDWLPHLSQAHRALGPFELSSLGRLAKWAPRVLAPAAVLLGVSVTSAVLLAFAPG